MNKWVKTTLVEDTSAYHSITGNFAAHRIENCPLIETNVDIEIPTFCIAWDTKHSLMKELVEVIKKYAI